MLCIQPFAQFQPSKEHCLWKFNIFLHGKWPNEGIFFGKLKPWSLVSKSWLCQCVKTPSSSHTLPQCLLRWVSAGALVSIPSGNFLFKENIRKFRPCKFTMLLELWHIMKEIEIMCRGLLCLFQVCELSRPSVFGSCNSQLMYKIAILLNFQYLGLTIWEFWNSEFPEFWSFW